MRVYLYVYQTVNLSSCFHQITRQIDNVGEKKKYPFLFHQQNIHDEQMMRI